jgi:leader peptidase (prepilin peptidase) / N-methyltransferase
MPVYIEPDGFVLLAAALVGLAIGSFLNVVILRWPVTKEREWFDECVAFVRDLAGRDSDEPTSDEKIAIEMAATLPSNMPERDKFNFATPRSRCRQCGHAISALENLPVISYVLLRGRCKSCGTTIGMRYPAVELLTAIATVVVISQLGVGAIGLTAAILTWALIAAAGIDTDTQLLPDDITLPFLWLGLVVNSFGFFASLEDAVIGAVAGYLSLWSVYWAFKLLTGKEGMGYGDFKLLALFGAWLGWQLLPVIILLSSIVGALVGIALVIFGGKDRDYAIPFGPYIAAAGWLALLWGHDITNAYLRYSGMGPPY